MVCGCGKVEGCCCDPKTVCKEVCQRKYNGWVNAEKIKLKKCGKYVRLILSNVRSFTLYQVYNEFNKKLNKDRLVFNIEKINYGDIQQFKNRTCYLEFQSCKDKHIQFSFYLKTAEYDLENNVWKWIVIPDKLYIDGTLINEYKFFMGRNICCSLDSSSNPQCNCNGTHKIRRGSETFTSFCQTADGCRICKWKSSNGKYLTTTSLDNVDCYN